MVLAFGGWSGVLAIHGKHIGVRSSKFFAPLHSANGGSV